MIDLTPRITIKSGPKYEIKVGNKVHFRDHVFDESCIEHYREYGGHQFEVVALHYDDSHVELKCLTGDVKVKGYVEIYDLRNTR